jgi:hypothetical protein
MPQSASPRPYFLLLIAGQAACWTSAATPAIATTTPPPVTPAPPAAAAGEEAASPPGDIHGHFPLLEAGFVGAFTNTPVGYILGQTATSDSVFGGIVGPAMQALVDTGAFLLDADGLYNLLSGQDVAWKAGAHVVAGYRSYANVVKSISDSPTSSSGYYTRTTEYYTHKFVPAYVGVSAGVTAIGLNGASSIDGSQRRNADNLIAIDAGFTLKSPQVEVTLAPLYEATRGTVGMRWVFGLALPIGDHLFGCRGTGEHFFGDDPVDGSGRRIQHIVTFALYLSSDFGIE